MNQFIELKINMDGKKIKRLVKVSEILSVIENNHGIAFVFMRDYLEDKDDPKRPAYYSNAVVVSTPVLNDYKELKKELTGKSILEP